MYASSILDKANKYSKCSATKKENKPTIIIMFPPKYIKQYFEGTKHMKLYTLDVHKRAISYTIWCDI